MINPGELKVPITFYKNEIAIDEEGFKNTTYTKILSTKCNPYNTKTTDNERSSENSYDSVSTSIYCRLRYHKDLNKDCIAEIAGVKYRIKSFTNVRFANKILELILQHG